MTYLTGPVNTLQDFQIEYNGLVIGNRTPFFVPPDGTWTFFDAAAVKTMDDPRVWADGSYSGPDFSDVLLPGVSVHIDAPDPTTFAGYVTAFRSAFGPQTSALPLWVKVPGFAPVGIGAKVNKRALPANNLWGAHAEGALQWRCPDPAWQSVPRSLSLAASASSTSGLNFPLFVPVTAAYAVPGVLDFGATATASSSGVLTNAGNTPAWPVAVVTGPVPSTGFTITIDNNTVTYNQAIPAGQSVTVDYQSGTALLTGGIDRTYALTARQFSPVTSSSPVFFLATTGSAVITTADIWR